MRATDLAGNRQVTVGPGALRVVRSGAPDFTPPWWPSGLVGSFSTASDHGLRPAWLLRRARQPDPSCARRRIAAPGRPSIAEVRAKR